LIVVACGRSSGNAKTTSTSDQPVAVGAVAPGFTLPSAHGGDVSLSDFVGKKPVLLYFSMGPG
jgi:peroxiredoxin